MTDFTTAFVVDRPAASAFAAINNVREWWTGDISGDTAAVGDVFTYQYGDIHRSTQRVVESVPSERVVWAVEDSYLSFADDKSEWTGTKIVFELMPHGEQTEVRFTHVGLQPEVECFDSCSSAWSYYINTSLRAFISA